VDFEWVVVNDGSTELDMTTFSSVGTTRLVINTGPRAGRAVAAQAGIKAASGDYIMLHDDDDKLMPGALLQLAASLDEDQFYVAVTCGYETFEERLGESDALLRSHSPKLPPQLYDMAERNRILTIGTLFRRDAYDRVGGIRTDISALEDWDLWLRLMTIGDFGIVSDVLARQYIRPDGTRGATANSEDLLHAQARIRLQNAYLRDDIASGRIGLGNLVHRPHAQFVEEMVDRMKRAGTLKRKLLPWTRPDKNT